MDALWIPLTGASLAALAPPALPAASVVPCGAEPPGPVIDLEAGRLRLRLGDGDAAATLAAVTRAVAGAGFELRPVVTSGGHGEGGMA